MQPYEQVRGHQSDFLVKYRLYSPSEGGREVTFQHLRCNFLYVGDDPQTDGVFMIHPEFLNASGEPLPEGVPVPLEGTASMWVAVPEMRAKVHRARVAVGVRGHFMEGARKIGDVGITQVLALHDNPAA